MNDDSADIGADALVVLSVPLVSARLLITTMESSKIGDSETQTKHSHDDGVVNDITGRGPPLKVVKSILKPSTNLNNLMVLVKILVILLLIQYR